MMKKVPNNKPAINCSITDFLNNDLFIFWRTSSTPKLDEYWADFISNHPEYEEVFNEAIVEMDRICEQTNVISESVSVVKNKLDKELSINKKNKKRIRFLSAVV